MTIKINLDAIRKEMKAQEELDNITSKVNKAFEFALNSMGAEQIKVFLNYANLNEQRVEKLIEWTFINLRNEMENKK